MRPNRCLFTVIDSPFERWERLLAEGIAPIVEVLRSRSELDSLFFARFNEPTWQIRFRVLGLPAWIDGEVRPLVERALEPLAADATIGGVEFGAYGRELDRYGGEAGMRLTERLYHLDSLACLDLIAAESKGLLARTRREYSLLFVERFLDLMRFDREGRLRFYERGYAWAIDDGLWGPDDFRTLDRKFEALKPGLIQLLGNRSAPDEEARWGGAEPAKIALGLLSASHPVTEELLEAHSRGGIPDLTELAWSWTHLHTNRLGVLAPAEAVMRYFMRRLHQEEAIVPGGAQ